MNKVLLNCKKISAAAMFSLLVINSQASANNTLQTEIDGIGEGQTITINNPITLTSDIDFLGKSFIISGTDTGSISTDIYNFNYPTIF